MPMLENNYIFYLKLFVLRILNSEIFEEKVLLKLLVLIRLGENKLSSFLGVEGLILLMLFIVPNL